MASKRAPNRRDPVRLDDSLRAGSSASPQDDVRGLLDGLNPEQRRAVTHPGGPLLIVAGAGTGKTTVIAKRIAWLVQERGIAADRILALTFTEKAATEMEERVDRLLPMGYVTLWISTFHGFCERVLRDHALDIGLPNDARLLDDTAAWLRMRQHLDRFALNYYRPRGNPTKFLHALHRHFSRCKDEAVSPAEYIAYARNLRLNEDSENLKSQISPPKADPPQAENLKSDPSDCGRIEELANAYHVYQQLLLEHHEYDFGDLLAYTLELLRTRPHILAQYRAKFPHVLVDEFQDTNWAQYEIVKLLAAPTNNLTVVGDDDQCLPAGTRITVRDGEVPIERIRAGMEVVTAVGKGYWSTSTVRKISHRTIRATHITVTTESGATITATANHKMFAAVARKQPVSKHLHYVYLMWRNGLGWRLGVTNDFAQRLRLERSADYVVALRDFSTDQEARYYETLWSLTYGIPTTCFKHRAGVAITGEWLQRLFTAVDTERGARLLARDLVIDLDAPQYCLGAVTRGSSRRTKIRVEFCVRNFGRKTAEGARMERPIVTHSVAMDTSNRAHIRSLRRAGMVVTKARRGYRFRATSVDIRTIEAIAQRLRCCTNGIVEYGFRVARSVHTMRAVTLPAGNIVRGLLLPIWHPDGIRYERVICVTREIRRETVYDFEVDRTHNYIANGFVVHNSVYAFRGAAMSNILHFKEDYPKATECVLTTNYRSRQEILDAAYTLIQQNNPARLETTLKINKRLVGAGGSGGSVRVLHAADASGEAQVIATQIRTLHDTDGVAWGDIAILSRANSHAEQILPALHAAGIPYLHLASRGLYRTDPVLDILSYLALLDDVHEGPAMYRVLSMPLWGIPYDDLLRLTTHERRESDSLYDICQSARKGGIKGISSSSVTTIDHIMTMVAKHTEIARRAPAHEVVLAFLEESKYLRDISDEETIEDHAAVAILNAFWKRMERFEAGADAPTIKEFMATIALERQAGELGAMPPDPQAGPDAVRVLTVHAAKGLEFRHVFIINMVELRFPSADRGEPIELPTALTKVILPEGDIHLQEERRLCYVAATRAKEGLWWTYADDYGGARARKPSRFLGEMSLREVSARPSVASERRRDVAIPAKKTPGLPRALQEHRSDGDLKVAATAPFHASPTHLSYTHLKDYETCPWMYHYRHVLKIPIPMRDKGAISFGKTIHNTLEKFFTRVIGSRSAQQGSLLDGDSTTHGDVIPPLTDLLAIYDQEWIGDWYLDAKHRDEAKARGREFLRGFYEQHTRDGWPSVRTVEQPFTFKVGDVSVTGSIDRVDDLPDGTVALVDYKTGKRPARFTAEEKRQLFVYQIAAQSLGMQPSVLLYTYFDGEAPASFIGADKDINATRDAFHTAYDGIRAQQFDATPSPNACNWCEYSSICPYSQKTTR